MTDSATPATIAATTPASPASPTPPIPRHDGWTPERQRAFLDHLSVSGLVRAAAADVGMSHEAAYKLRHNAEALLVSFCDVRLEVRYSFGA